MFTGTMDTLAGSRASYAAPIRNALSYLASHDFTKMADGAYVIEEGKITANLQRYTTRPAAACKPESHKKFVDIQFVVAGEEELGWCPLDKDLPVAVPYDEQKDIVFYEQLRPVSTIALLPGTFAVLFPEDVHRPQVTLGENPASVTKVVVKIAVDCL